MDWKIFFFASYEMTISIIFSLLTIFITKRIIDKMIIGRSSNYGDYKDKTVQGWPESLQGITHLTTT